MNWLALFMAIFLNPLPSAASPTPAVEHVSSEVLREATRATELARLATIETRPGIRIGGDSRTVVVIARRDQVSFGAVDGPRRFASEVAGDVVVNANWFVGSGSFGPVVVDGVVSGSADTIERGQIVELIPGCRDGSGHGAPPHLEHIWTWELYTPDECVRTAVSGVSLVHRGARADAVAGIDLVRGYTMTATAHSFVGFNASEIIIVSSTAMNASRLADYALLLGAEEGLMLDGGGSTQIKTPTHSIGSPRPVPSFVVISSHP